MSKKLLLIINPVSGMRLAPLYIQKICAVLAEGDWDVFTMLTTKRGDATEWAEKYGTDFDLVVACGGDGTFNEVVSGNLHGAKKPLGYIPCGSTNDFAASIGLSSEVGAAAKAIADGHVHSIDAGSFGGRGFTYVASFGAFTRASYATSQGAKNVLGHLAYILQGGLEIKNIRPEYVSIEADGVTHEGDYLFGAISNSTSLGGVLSLSLELVDMNDGKFEVILIKVPENAVQLTRIIHAITTQQLDECELIDFFPASHIVVNKNPPGGWSLDGEFEQGENGVEIENLHSAIQLVF